MSEIKEVTPAEVAALYGQTYIEPVLVPEPVPKPENAPVAKTTAPVKDPE